jgi:hypothetical protein
LGRRAISSSHHVGFIHSSQRVPFRVDLPPNFLYRLISIPELLFSLQHHLVHPDPDDVHQEGPYRDSREESDQKIERQAKHFTREDFLDIASLSFKLEPKEWIIVTDTMRGKGLDGQV